MKNLLLILLLVSGAAFAQSNITGINPPNSGDVDYVNKIKNSFTAVDGHDHSAGKGLPVSRIGAQVVGAAELAVGAVGNTQLANDAVTTAKILNSNVTTGKLADGAVTKAKLSAANCQISANSGLFSTTSTSYVDVTNLSVTLTVTGRPVHLMIVSNGGGGASGTTDVYSQKSSGAFDVSSYFRFVEGVVILSDHILAAPFPSGFARLTSPASVLSHLYIPSAGTYTYKLQVVSLTGGVHSVGVSNAKLVVCEM